MNKRIALLKIIYCALFAALSFAATNIRIPLPSGGMIHLGNFVCVIAALLCGPIIGGLSGGIGCGLFDLIMYSSVDGMIKYFILKLIMGLIVGYLFKAIVTKHKKMHFTLAFIVLGAIFALAATLTIILYRFDLFNLSSSITNKTLYIWIVAVFGYIFALGLFALALTTARVSKSRQCVIFVVTISVISNIILEFLYKLGYSYLITSSNVESDSLQPIILALSTMPSCLLTGCLTIGLSGIVFISVYKATKRINKMSYVDLDEYERDDLNV